ncbi:hypothetical protein DIPPA_17313 [Diplonema papillatum]|nr:hypothetical protein DIPPA_17313 [Diplonema papillatum]
MGAPADDAGAPSAPCPENRQPPVSVTQQTDGATGSSGGVRHAAAAPAPPNGAETGQAASPHLPEQPRSAAIGAHTAARVQTRTVADVVPLSGPETSVVGGGEAPPLCEEQQPPSGSNVHAAEGAGQLPHGTEGLGARTLRTGESTALHTAKLPPPPAIQTHAGESRPEGSPRGDIVEGTSVPGFPAEPPRSSALHTAKPPPPPAIQTHAEESRPEGSTPRGGFVGATRVPGFPAEPPGPSSRPPASRLPQAPWKPHDSPDQLRSPLSPFSTVSPSKLPRAPGGGWAPDAVGRRHPRKQQHPRGHRTRAGPPCAAVRELEAEVLRLKAELRQAASPQPLPPLPPPGEGALDGSGGTRRFVLDSAWGPGSPPCWEPDAKGVGRSGDGQPPRKRSPPPGNGSGSTRRFVFDRAWAPGAPPGWEDDAKAVGRSGEGGCPPLPPPGDGAPTGSTSSSRRFVLDRAWVPGSPPCCEDDAKGVGRSGDGQPPRKRSPAPPRGHPPARARVKWGDPPRAPPTPPVYLPHPSGSISSGGTGFPPVPSRRPVTCCGWTIGLARPPADAASPSRGEPPGGGGPLGARRGSGGSGAAGVGRTEADRDCRAAAGGAGNPTVPVSSVAADDDSGHTSHVAGEVGLLSEDGGADKPAVAVGGTGHSIAVDINRIPRVVDEQVAVNGTVSSIAADDSGHASRVASCGDEVGLRPEDGGADKPAAAVGGTGHSIAVDINRIPRVVDGSRAASYEDGAGLRSAESEGSNRGEKPVVTADDTDTMHPVVAADINCTPHVVDGSRAASCEDGAGSRSAASEGGSVEKPAVAVDGTDTTPADINCTPHAVDESRASACEDEAGSQPAVSKGSSRAEKPADTVDGNRTSQPEQCYIASAPGGGECGPPPEKQTTGADEAAATDASSTTASGGRDQHAAPNGIDTVSPSRIETHQSSYGEAPGFDAVGETDAGAAGSQVCRACPAVAAGSRGRGAAVREKVARWPSYPPQPGRAQRQQGCLPTIRAGGRRRAKGAPPHPMPPPAPPSRSRSRSRSRGCARLRAGTRGRCPVAALLAGSLPAKRKPLLGPVLTARRPATEESAAGWGWGWSGVRGGPAALPRHVAPTPTPDSIPHLSSGFLPTLHECLSLSNDVAISAPFHRFVPRG